MNEHRERLPELRARGGEVIDPGDPERLLQVLTSDARVDLFRGMKTAVRTAARAVLDESNTYTPTGSKTREPDKSGYQAMQHYFGLETWSDPPTFQYRRNELFLEARRRNEELPAEVAPVPEHIVAVVTAHCATPWGTRLSRTRTCSTAGKHFWLSRDGRGRTYNVSKYRNGAEHIAAGIAETRALNAVTDAALALGYQPMTDDELTEAARRQREKEEAERRWQLQEEWQNRLRREDVTGEEEGAFYRQMQPLPDLEEDFEADDYQVALEIVNRHGRRIFEKALAKERGDVQKEKPESNGRASPDPEAVDERAEAPPEEPPPSRERAKEAKERQMLLTSIRGTCKLLGEDETYAADLAGGHWPDAADEDGLADLEELELERLELLDHELTEELKNA